MTAEQAAAIDRLLALVKARADALGMTADRVPWRVAVNIDGTVEVRSRVFAAGSWTDDNTIAVTIDAFRAAVWLVLSEKLGGSIRHGDGRVRSMFLLFIYAASTSNLAPVAAAELAVFGDQLMTAGDPRGEIIAAFLDDDPEVRVKAAPALLRLIEKAG